MPATRQVLNSSFGERMGRVRDLIEPVEFVGVPGDVIFIHNRMVHSSGHNLGDAVSHLQCSLGYASDWPGGAVTANATGIANIDQAITMGNTALRVAGPLRVHSRFPKGPAALRIKVGDAGQAVGLPGTALQCTFSMHCIHQLLD